MYIEDSPMSEAQTRKFIEIVNRWWKEAEDKNIRIVPYAVKRDGKWYAVAKLFKQPIQEWTEPLD